MRVEKHLYILISGASGRLMRIPTQIDTHSAGKSAPVPIEIDTCSEANRHPIRVS